MLIVAVLLASVATLGATSMSLPDGAALAANTKKPAPSHTSATTDPAMSADPVPLRRAALRIKVTTSSDWVQVDLPGVSAGHVSVAGDRKVRPTHRGVVVSGPVRVMGSATIDVVTEISREAADGLIAVSQGGAGKSTVQVLNRTSSLRDVATVSTDWSRTKHAVPVTVDALMGPEQLEWTRADAQRRVLAIIYPWFSGEWATTSDRLTAHPTSTWNTTSLDSALVQARQARAHGIDGFVVSFSGAKAHGLPLHLSLAAAERTGGTATILLETTAASSAAEAEQWLAEALQQSDSPAFMRLDGVPVVFTFATGSVPAATWQAIADRLTAAGTPVKIISDVWRPDGPSSGLYRYNALLQTPTDPMTMPELTDWNQVVSRRLRASATLGVGRPAVVVATVQPGWHRYNSVEGEVPIPRQGTDTLDATWTAALAAEPDWVLITSWNEWYEGTGIAPSVEYGTTALAATERWSELFHG